MYHAFPSLFNFQLSTFKLKVESWNLKSDGKAWYARKSTTKVIQTYDTLENQQTKWCKRMIHSKFRFANFECIMRLHHFFCWFSSVSCVCITCFVDFRVYHAFLSHFLLIFECIMPFHYFSSFNFQLSTFNFSTFQLSTFNFSTFQRFNFSIVEDTESLHRSSLEGKLRDRGAARPSSGPIFGLHILDICNYVSVTNNT